MKKIAIVFVLFLAFGQAIGQGSLVFGTSPVSEARKKLKGNSGNYTLTFDAGLFKIVGLNNTYDISFGDAETITSRTLTLTGGTGVTVTGGTQDLSANRTWTISLPQSVATSASPTFAGLTVGNVNSTEFGYLDGVTSAIQTQFAGKANLASPALTGTPTAPTATTGANNTQIATTAFVINSINTLTFSDGLEKQVNTVRNNLITGKQAGQTIIGDINPSGNLTITSTANATKGKILFGNSAYDEENNRLGLGTQTPTTKLEIVGGSGFKYVDGNQALNKYLRSNADGIGRWGTIVDTDVTGLDEKYYKIAGGVIYGASSVRKKTAYNGSDTLFVMGGLGTGFGEVGQGDKLEFKQVSFTGVPRWDISNFVAGSSQTNLSFSGQNIGIKTTSPAYNLDVDGTMRVVGQTVLPTNTTIGNVSSTELGYIDGVTSAIQTQFAGKANLASPAFTGITTINGTVKITDGTQGAGKLLTSSADGTITAQTPLLSTKLSREIGRDFPALLNGEAYTFTQTLSGAALGDFVQVTFGDDIGSYSATAYVSSANTIKVVIVNNTGSSSDLGLVQLFLRVLK